MSWSAIFSKAFQTLLLSICTAAKEAFSYLNGIRQDKQQKIKEKQQKEHDSKIDDIADHGTVSDLLDLRRSK